MTHAAIEGSDMSHGCSQGLIPKTGHLWAQNDNVSKQRKYKYFTSQKWDLKNMNRFTTQEVSHLKLLHFTSQHYFTYKILEITDKYLHKKTSL